MATLKSIKNKYLVPADGTVLGVTTNTENISALSFKLATADSLSKFNLVDGFTDDYNDATGVDAVASNTATTRSTSNYYSGVDEATGGTVTSHGSYTVHTFLDDGNFVVGASGNVDALIVAGGGAGGGHQGGGGGGAGGARVLTSIPYIAGTYAVAVGAGGISTGGCNASLTEAENSSLAYNGGTHSATRGGWGGGCGNASQSGGSGGGGAGTTGGSSGSGGNTGGYSPGEGQSGGTGQGNSPNAPPHLGGGGGGALNSGQSYSIGADGGPGLQNDYRTGSNIWYAGGGGGGAGTGGGPTGNGGTGGGGSVSQGDIDGDPNTGGGGGGSRTGAGGTGGSGIVVIRYTGIMGVATDMSLQSNVFTAQSDPTTARIILDEWAYKGTQVLDTDIKAYASRDNGTTFTQMPLSSQGDLTPTADGGIQGNTILMMHCDGANGGTTFTDVSSEGGNTAQTCTANGNAQTKTDQFKFGTASAYFDGTGDYVAVTGDAEQWAFASADFTIDFWIRPGTASTQQRVFGDLNSGGSAAGFEFIQGGDDKMGFSGSAPVGLAMNDPTAMTMDTWYHFAVTRLGNEFRMYRDGVSVATVTIAGGMHRGLIPIGIGRSGDYNAQYFEGYIDEVRIQNGIAVWSGATSFTPPVRAYAVSRRLVSGSVDISGQPAGSNMKYKITTHNQTADLQTRVYGTSMAWA